jgi:hypothetical protein
MTFTTHMPANAGTTDLIGICLLCLGTLVQLGSSRPLEEARHPLRFQCVCIVLSNSIPTTGGLWRKAHGDESLYYLLCHMDYWNIYDFFLSLT